jgi:hypothetical protein
LEPVRKETSKLGLRFALAGAAVILVSLGGCSSSNGSGGDGGASKMTSMSGDGGACGGLESTDVTCNACLQTSCCTQGIACGNDAACLTLNDCVANCVDDACAQQCVAANSTGVTDYDALTSCATSSCGGPCSGAVSADGGVCGFVLDTASCSSCFGASCCAAGNACSGNAECVALETCLGGCNAGDTTCETSCSTQHPNGIADLNAVGDCIQGTCGVACGFIDADAGLACGGFSSDDACTNTCLTTTCCTPGATCGSNAACLQLFACAQGCSAGDDTCLQTCANQNPGGVSDYNAGQVCLASCGCGGDGGPTGADASGD